MVTLRVNWVMCICVVLIYKNGFRLQNILIIYKHKTIKMSSKMSMNKSFEKMLQKRGVSQKAIKELWKWFDYSEKKGVASF